MTVGTPVPFEVEKNALRPSGCSSLVSGKTPSIVLPSYSFQSSIVDRPVLGIGQGESREGQRKQTYADKHNVDGHASFNHELLSFIAPHGSTQLTCPAIYTQT